MYFQEMNSETTTEEYVWCMDSQMRRQKQGIAVVKRTYQEQR